MLSTQVPFYQEQVLFEGLRENKPEEVRSWILDFDFDFNKVELETGKIPLHIALEPEHAEEMVGLLLENGADINEKSPLSRNTVLQEACYQGMLSVVRRCIEQGNIEKDSVDPQWVEYTLLHAACCNDDIEMVKYLLGVFGEANLLCENKEGLTPYHVAAQSHYGSKVFKYFCDTDRLRVLNLYGGAGFNYTPWTMYLQSTSSTERTISKPLALENRKEKRRVDEAFDGDDGIELNFEDDSVNEEELEKFGLSDKNIRRRRLPDEEEEGITTEESGSMDSEGSSESPLLSPAIGYVTDMSRELTSYRHEREDGTHGPRLKSKPRNLKYMGDYSKVIQEEGTLEESSEEDDGAPPLKKQREASGLREVVSGRDGLWEFFRPIRVDGMLGAKFRRRIDESLSSK